MIVEFAGGIIAAASGTLFKSKRGTRVVFTTRRAPSSNPHKVRMYIRTAKDYQRSTPVTEREKQVRELFSKRQQCVNQLRAFNHKLSVKDAWAIAIYEIKD